MTQKQPNPLPTSRRPPPPPPPPKPGIRIVWVCGKAFGKDDNGNTAWELQGVFDTKAKAEAACHSVNDFIGPVPLNQPMPQETTEWLNCSYPLAR